MRLFQVIINNPVILDGKGSIIGIVESITLGELKKELVRKGYAFENCNVVELHPMAVKDIPTNETLEKLMKRI